MIRGNQRGFVDSILLKNYPLFFPKWNLHQRLFEIAIIARIAALLLLNMSLFFINTFLNVVFFTHK